MRRLPLVGLLPVVVLGALALQCVGEDLPPVGPGPGGGGEGGVGDPDGAVPPPTGDDGGRTSDGGVVDAAPGETWDGNFGPAPASAAEFRWNRILDDGTNTSYNGTAAHAGFLGHTVIVGRLTTNAMSIMSDAASPGTGFFVAKVRRDDTAVLWRKKFAGPTMAPSDVIVDEADAVFVTGTTPAGGSVALTSTVSIPPNHGFILEMNGATGEVVWAKDLGATTSYLNGISTKPGQPLVVTGGFKGALSYPRQTGTAFTSNNTTARFAPLVAKLDRATGNAVWVRTFLSDTLAGPLIAADPTDGGDVEIALAISGTVTTEGATLGAFGSGSVVALTRVSAANGAPTATRSYRVDTNSVAVRALPGGAVVVAGDGSGTTEIPPGTARTTTDAWIMGTSSAHVATWTKWLTGKYVGQSTDRREYFACLDVDHWGRILFGAESPSTGLRFDGVDIPSARNSGQTAQLFLAKLQPSGDVLWSKAVHAGDAAEVRPYSCRFGLNGDTHFTAFLSSSAAPNFGGGPISGVPNGTAAVVKWGP